jgi:hypothetical protein
MRVYASRINHKAPRRGGWPSRTLTRHGMPNPWQFHGWAAANSAWHVHRSQRNRRVPVLWFRCRQTYRYYGAGYSHSIFRFRNSSCSYSAVTLSSQRTAGSLRQAHSRLSRKEREKWGTQIYLRDTSRMEMWATGHPAAHQLGAATRSRFLLSRFARASE